MPTLTHESLIEMIRNRPALAADLLAKQCGLPLPQHQTARLDSGDLTEVIPTEYRADAVVVLAAENCPVLAVVVEVQLGRDLGKQWSWPVYLTTLRARLHCPAILLVLCTKPAVARWCATEITIGHPDWVLKPLVLGPEQVPVVTEVEEAEHNPELAVLSAITHARHPQLHKILRALFGALDGIDKERALFYQDIVFTALPAAAASHPEADMASVLDKYRSDFARRYVSQGLAEGEAKGLAEGEAKGLAEGEAKGLAEGEARGRAVAVLEVLAARGIQVTAEVRARISGCTDVDQLDTLIRRAATVNTAAELFD